MHAILIAWLALAFFANRAGDTWQALYYIGLALVVELYMILARLQR